MKIGKFAEINKLSIDTIRHYMNLNLIVPSKHGSQYEFDDACQRDLQDVIKLKSMGFELKEIKSILYYKRLANLTQYEEDEYYKEIFQSKLDEICESINNLSENKNILKKKIEEIASKNENIKRKIGIDLRVLSKLCCHKCKGELYLADGSIEDNQIINGRLKCICGEEYTIDDGILIVNNDSRVEDEEISYKRIIDYINSTSTNYLDSMYKGHELMCKNIDFKAYENKIFLELGSGLGFSLRMIYKDIPDTAVYIAVDHNINTHRFLKGSLERTKQKKNIIFICGDFLNIPIKDESVDMLLDFSGSSNYSFDNEEFLLNNLTHYIKKDSELLGSYILFKNFSANSNIDKKYRSSFKIEFIKDNLNKLRYKKKFDITSDLIEEGGIYEPYFKAGEKVYFYIFHGKR